MLRVKENIFASKDEAIMAYELEKIAIHAAITVRLFREIDGVMKVR